jgi:DUF4097 and DUF4098 domain-containing protein YvlB
MRRLTQLAALTLTAVAAATIATAATAQTPDARDWLEQCQRGWSSQGSAREQVCEVRELRLPADGGLLAVDGRANGGVRVEAWDRNEILIQALIQATATTASEARSHAEGIQIRTDDGRVRAEGPRVSGDGSWSVGYRVYVPARTDLDLRASNGGIRVTGVAGRIDMVTQNGGITVTDVSGDVRGRTTNGGVTARLAGQRWDGSGLDLQTTNGSVTLQVPAAYSARIQTGTVNGRMQTDFPITVQGELRRELSFDVGQGGAPIRVRTTNGAVRIQRI